MKKILSFAIAFLLMVSVVLAAGQQGADDKGPEAVQISEPSQHEEIQERIETKKQVKTEEMLAPSKVQTGEYSTAGGKKVQVQEQEGNQIKFQANGIAARTSMQMNREFAEGETKLKVQLSNGRHAEIKIMPDTASARAIERLQLKVCQPENCQIELKEVGQGEQTRAAYEVQAQKQVKVLGLFKAKMQVQAQIDAENGEVISSKKPWWAFIASDAE